MATDRPPSGPRSPEESLLVAVFDESPVATLRTSVSAGRVDRILEANAAARGLVGRADLEGLRLADLAVAGSLLDVGLRPTQHLLSLSAPREGGADTAATIRWIEATVAPLSAAGSPGEPAALVVLVDVTERRAHERHRDSSARRDPLTGLGDRAELLGRLAELSVATDGPFVAALFLDVDRFKRINDYWGHAAGDDVLRAVAARLRSVVRPGDTLARVGGDEFVVLCPAVNDPEDARAIAERIRVAISEPLPVAGRQPRVTVSVGLATAGVGAVESAALLQAADAAMYAAKQVGRNRVAVAPAGQPQTFARRITGLRWGSRRRLG
jgi:diguanylate cyclase (GGDEF)-like protein